MNQEPIFILGLHKSGTSLLRNLLDSHSGLFIIPIESHIFQHNKYWIDYSIRSQLSRTADSKDIINSYIDWIHKSNEVNNNKQADSVTIGFWNVENFRNNLLKYKKDDFLNIKLSIEHYFESLYFSLYGKEINDNIRVVEKSVENAEFAIDLKTIFPKAKFIHIVRNPYSNLLSIRKFKSSGRKYPFLKQIIGSMQNNYYYLDKNKRVLGDDYLIIRYEDLVSDADSTMKKIANYLDIDYEKILLKPTVLGEFWKGNSTANKDYTGISNTHLSSWKKAVAPLEIGLVNKLFESVLYDNGYEKCDKKSSLYNKNKGEKIGVYILNRLLYKYFLN